MSFLYDIPTDTIVHAEDGGLIATLEETVDPEDSLKMAAGPDLFDTLGAIYYAHQIGELPLPTALAEAAGAALLQASPPWNTAACDRFIAHCRATGQIQS